MHHWMLLAAAITLLVVPVRPPDALGQAALGDDVRVRLFDLDEPASISLSAHGGPVRLFAGDYADPLAELEDGESAVISRASDQLHVTIREMALFAQSLRAEPAEGAAFGVRIEEGAQRRDLRRYAGRLFVETDGNAWEVQLINEVPLEEYVASVVASEYGFDDLEGSMAMAVLVRTYTLGVLGKYGSGYDHVDHTLSQVYEGIDAATPVSREAARRTAGEVLTHDGEIIRAVYFSTSGGRTADNETVWDGPPLPYLRGKRDPYGSDSPHDSWTSRLSRPDLLAELRAAYGRNVEGFLIGDRSRDGRVASVELVLAGGGRRQISGNDFRLLVTRRFGPHALRSTLFDARRVGDEYRFEGRGFGHGVGLSQWGAHEMALRDMTYGEILEFYYTGVELVQLDGTAVDPPVRVARESDPPGRVVGTGVRPVRAAGLPGWSRRAEDGERSDRAPGRSEQPSASDETPDPLSAHPAPTEERDGLDSGERSEEIDSSRTSPAARPIAPKPPRRRIGW